jgi:hypothetical protein
MDDKTIMEILPDKLASIIVDGRVNMIQFTFRTGSKIILGGTNAVFVTDNGEAYEQKSFQQFIDWINGIQKLDK